MTPEDASVRIAELAVEAQKEEYKEIWEQWKVIDSKAQGVIVVSGIALTGLFAVLRDNPPKEGLSRCFVSISVFLAFLAAVSALLALRVRTVKSAPLGKPIAELVAEIQAKPQDSQNLPERYARLLNDIRNLWARPLEDNNAAMSDKASWVWVAQLSVVASMLALGAVTLLRIFGP